MGWGGGGGRGGGVGVGVGGVGVERRGARVEGGVSVVGVYGVEEQTNAVSHAAGGRTHRHPAPKQVTSTTP